MSTTTNGLRDLAALAADDADIGELVVYELPAEALFDLDAYHHEWDTGALYENDPPHTRPAVPWHILLPINAVLVAIIVVSLLTRGR